MGNISDALRRAQEERDALRRQRRTEPPPQAPPPPVAVEAADAPPAVEPPPAPETETGAGARPPAAVDNNLPPIDLNAMPASYVAWHDRAAAVSEQYRSLRTRLMNLNQSKGPMVIGVTSSVAGEGKTTSTMNLAVTFAELQHLNVLAADGDLRRYTLTQSLRCEDGDGMAEVLRGHKPLGAVVRRTSAAGLSFLPAGHLGAQNAAEILGSHASENLLAEFRRRWHYVFVDLPPANAVADASILGHLCDGVLLVVRMHRTAEPNVKHAARLLESSNVRMLGCVLVGQRHWKAPWLHEYGYGYDYQGTYSGYYRA